MIAVVGEALIDLVVDDEGGVVARPGGGPFNTARTLARLGAPTLFLGQLSADPFGRMLRDRLDRDGVALGVPAPAPVPTTLAVADVGPGGAASYEFYLTGTAAADVEYPVLAAALPDELTAFHLGSLALVMEPIACSIERLMADLPPDALVMVDPNCRPGAIADRDFYLDRFERLMHRADAVKVSVDDLAYLCPGVPVEVAATTLLGEKLALVLVTDGSRPARAFLPTGEVSVDVPPVRVVDTIGAGDAFGGGFLAWWAAHGLGRDDLRLAGPVRDALRAAAWVAALTCAKAGAEPPWRAEVQESAGTW
ncbi:PfkB family carbohydrate kinase [Trebonia sp.]|uniref:PfkB family carbohydrate kinase n=1 Tax=Trebonia sp. TaxID=2767075 RepID=UPI002630BDCD|nr:PfkB family carbohydrate kinase [Trebonia sp.]